VRRIAASGLTAVIAVAFVVSAIAQGGGPKAALFVLPNLLSSAAVAAMLLLSLANRPSVVDDGWGILAGSFAVSNMYVLVPLLGPFLFSTHPLAALQRVAVVGTLATLPLYLVAVLTLGRNLTVLPEANALQTRGVYALSRHPLYAIYILWYAL
jgi:protein-S-isoprenylcysteine O-methyltransferase Ste14